MVFSNFRLQVILRGIGIGLTTVGFAWSIYRTEFLMTPIVFALITILQLIGLIWYAEGALNDIKRFSESFIDSDYMRKFDETKRGRVFENLGHTFNKIIEDFKRIRIEKEEHYQYLLQVNRYVNVGLICFTKDGKIDLMNAAAAALLDKPILNRMEHIANLDQAFHDLLTNLKPGEKYLYKSAFTDDHKDLAITTNKFILKKQEYTLVSLQDIRAELDAHEMTAWQKLVRVLTHEIMNSVTPVVSLTTAVKLMMESDGKPINVAELNEETGEDIYRSIAAIESRSRGLLNFVNAYRDYTKPLQLELETVSLHALVNETLLVLKPNLQHVDLQVDPKSSESATVNGDPKLLIQVLINLVKNAGEALEGCSSPQVRIAVQTYAGQHCILVSDNGAGIPEAIKDEIFVPFFTTKEKGTGIGLSLSKQIMKAHNGDILVDSDSNGTRFKLLF